MLGYAAPLQRLIDELSKLPGIGPKSAQRLAFYLLNAEEADVAALGEAILQIKSEIGRCQECFNYATEQLCPICQDPTRDCTVLCIVEQPSDLMALERAGEFRGLYHVLGGALSPVEGLGPGDLNISQLRRRIQELGCQEVILATSPTVEGDATAEFLRGELAGLVERITRIALGLPVGGDLDYADQVTLARSLRGRTLMEE